MPVTYLIDLDAVPDWRPLRALAALIRASSGRPSFDPGEFMYGGAVRSPAGLVIHLYKHVETRRYLSIDASGHAYRYLGGNCGAGRRFGAYEPFTDLRRALRHVERRTPTDESVVSRRGSADSVRPVQA
jgi:hypothetical protein